MQSVSGGAGIRTQAALATQMGDVVDVVSSHPQLTPHCQWLYGPTISRTVVLYVNSTPRCPIPPISTKSNVREVQTQFVILSLRLPIFRVSLCILDDGNRMLATRY